MKISDGKYLLWIRSQPCTICGWQSSWETCVVHHCGGDPEHTRRGNDKSVISLCVKCHADVHAHPAEKRDELREKAKYYRAKYEKEIL